MTRAIRAVTGGQLAEVGKMAREKGVGRDAFQFGLDDGIFAAALDEAKGRHALGGFPLLTAGRILVLLGILVREDEDWTAALESAGPDTSEDYIIRQVGHLYPPSGRGGVRKDFVLLNRPGWDLDQFLAWGKTNRLKGTTARDVFAVGREKPNLNRELGMDPLWVHATDVRSFEGDRRLPYVWWDGAERGADHNWVGRVGDANAWCLLSRESEAA